LLAHALRSGTVGIRLRLAQRIESGGAVARDVARVAGVVEAPGANQRLWLREATCGRDAGCGGGVATAQ
jgi:hypothetical protein